MCLAPETKGASLQSLIRAEYASALVTLDLPASGEPGPARRARLWDLEDKLHCPVIGTCLSMSELHGFARRFQISQPGVDDFTLHVEVVGLARNRNPLSEAVQRHLEKKYRLSVTRFAKLKTDQEIRREWRASCARGDVAGPLWAICTHRSASAETCQQVYADLHMLSHQVGAGQAADTRRLAFLEKENVELKEGLRRELAALRRQLGAAEAGLADRDAVCSEAALLRKRLARFESGEVMIEMGQRLLALQGSHERLLDSTRLLQEAERGLKDAREEARRAISERDEVIAERDALLRVLELAQPAACAEPGSDACAGCPDALSARCVLYVGGRASLLAQYRQLAERLGITLIHHDGGLEESLSRLPDLIRGADAVVCPTDRISHNAYYHVKSQCKRVGKPCLFYRGGGVSGFAAAMERLSRGEFSLAGLGEA